MATFESWVDVVKDHGFTVTELSDGSFRVSETAWKPDTGEHYDEIVSMDSDGELSGIEVVSGTNQVTREVEYHNLRHFLGY